MTRSSVLALLLGSLALLVGSLPARADQANVTAVLTSSETELGRPVQLQIKVTGTSSANPPAEIAVDGLDIRPTGSSQSFEMRGFNVSSSITYNYTVMPERIGNFTIPPQDVRIGSNTLKTPALNLNVAQGSGGTARSRRGTGGSPQGEAIDPDKIGFVELVLARNEAYVGEMIPAQIRIGISARVPLQSLQGIDIAGQGFTTQKMPDARQSYDTVDGRTYQVLTYKTAISAARPGKFDVGPVEVRAVVRVPRPLRNQQIFPRDLFDMNDPFFDNFFKDPAFAPSVAKEVTLKSEPIAMEIKPLPGNAPPTFTGAIGNFAIEADAQPRTVKMGDPVTVTAKITGRGNFGRVNAPILSEEKGWHSYPPSPQFTQDDEVGMSGTKTFEMVLTPNTAKEAVPSLVFSFFDPLKETYRTVKSDPIPIQVTGAPAVAPSPPVTAPTAGPAQTAPPRAAADELLPQLPPGPDPLQSFAPLHARPAFWFAQVVPLLLLLGFIVWSLRRRHLGDRAARRLAALQAEAAELERSLRRDDLKPDDYFAQAAQAVRLKTALAGNANPNVVDLDLALRTFQVDAEQREQLRRLFERNDELRYSGGGNGHAALTPENRQRINDLVASLKK